MRVGPEVPRLARRPPGTEPEFVIHPDAPDHHYMRPSIRTGRGQPVLLALAQSVVRPLPWQQTFPALREPVPGNVWTRCFRWLALFGHACLSGKNVRPRRRQNIEARATVANFQIC